MISTRGCIESKMIAAAHVSGGPGVVELRTYTPTPAMRQPGGALTVTGMRNELFGGTGDGSPVSASIALVASCTGTPGQASKALHPSRNSVPGTHGCQAPPQVEEGVHLEAAGGRDGGGGRGEAAEDHGGGPRRAAGDRGLLDQRSAVHSRARRLDLGDVSLVFSHALILSSTDVDAGGASWNRTSDLILIRDAL